MTDATSNSTTTTEKTTLVDTLFDIGTGWAAQGLNIGKLALEQSAKTLEKTAKALESLASELEKKHDAEKK